MSESANLDGRSFALSGPMKITDPAHTAVRGDLAHIALAGRYFVPHYAVPLPRRIAASGAQLRAGVRDDAEPLAELSAGARFDVLDIAGQTAWGQVEDCGLVGYVALSQLEEAA
ncbi:MAG: SH3 domain-containing protein [Novosphingobium sp.]